VDEIPIVWSKSATIIANTDDHTKSGTHWIAMYVGRDGVGHYFDSYRFSPIIPQHRTRFKRNCKILFNNAHQFQSNTSDTCGQFCVMFLHLMCTGFGMHRLRDIFSNDLSRNDKIALNYYNSYMDHQQRYISKQNQSTGRGISNSNVVSQTQSCYSQIPKQQNWALFPKQSRIVLVK